MWPLLLAVVASPSVQFEPARPRLGDPVVVYVSGVEHGGEPGTAEAFGYEFSLMPTAVDTLRGVLAVPIDTAPGRYRVAIRHDSASVPPKALHVVDRDFERSELRVAPRFTQRRRSRKVRARLRRERRAIRGVWAAEPTPAVSFGRPKHPTGTESTGTYGTARVFNGKTRSRHYGLDLEGDVGDPVQAVAAGTVALSSDRYFSGGTVVLDHGAGLFTLYFHLSKRRVRPGDRVEAGDRIGDVGRSGRVTGPHLHLSVAVRAVYASGERKGRARAMYVEPETLLGLRLQRAPGP